MLKRQRVVAAILQKLNLDINDYKASLLIYIYFNKYNHPKQYHFIKYNTFRSFALEEDKGYIAGKMEEKRYIYDLDLFEKLDIKNLENNFLNKNIEELESEIKIAEYSGDNSNIFFTIGYEGQDIDQYINKLLSNNIKLLCDVRGNAYSSKFGFKKHELERICGEVGIDYMHIEKLGIESEKRKESTDKNKLFDEFETNLKHNPHFKILQDLFRKYGRIAITCFEENYRDCHRNRIIKNLDSGIIIQNL